MPDTPASEWKHRARTVLVTGADGFIGRRLCAYLSWRGERVRRAVRGTRPGISSIDHSIEVGDIGPSTDWGKALEGVEVVVHLAARAHVLREVVNDPLADFRRVNVAGSLNLARQAAAAEVKRLVFVSSIGVNGSETRGVPFAATDPPAPHSPYSFSKLEAEECLRRTALETGLQVVIVRPPLVIGPGAPGNFRRLLDILRRGIPLPLASVDNRRSFVAVDNLVDLIAVCLRHERAGGQTLLVSDGTDLSTPELLRCTGRALGLRVRLFQVPPYLLRSAAALLGWKEVAQRLCGSLQVDIGPTCRLLDWHPPISVEEGLRRAVQDAPT